MRKSLEDKEGRTQKENESSSFLLKMIKLLISFG